MGFENQQNKITKIIPGSKADKLGISEGDILISINEQKIIDIVDYIYLTSDEFVNIEILSKEGKYERFRLHKGFEEDIGIIFENPIIDEAKRCQNKCIFCFIDQLPKGMRDTLYFKDDDSRLSFLQGNFITLTNMKNEDIEKIVRYRISPINISIHTTDKELRQKMLNNKNADNIYERLKQLCSEGILIHGQIVLCPDINDKDILSRTINDLVMLYPQILDVAIVPVGITKYREKLFPLKLFNKETATSVIYQVEQLQEKFLKKINSRFVFLSDEFYIMAEKDLPAYNEYEGFPQIENGVGLIRKFEHEFLNALKNCRMENSKAKNISIITGKSAEKFMKKICKEFEKKYPNINLTVFPITNNFFGETITVSGLITGSDIISQLKGKKLGDRIIIPESMLKASESVFLDDIKILDLEKSFNVPVVVSELNGKDFIEKIIK